MINDCVDCANPENKYFLYYEGTLFEIKACQFHFWPIQNILDDYSYYGVWIKMIAKHLGIETDPKKGILIDV